MNEKISLVEKAIEGGNSLFASSWKEDSNLKGAFFSYGDHALYLGSEEIFSSKTIRNYLNL